MGLGSGKRGGGQRDCEKSVERSYSKIFQFRNAPKTPDFYFPREIIRCTIDEVFSLAGLLVRI